MLLAALIFAFCGYGLWYYVSTGERRTAGARERGAAGFGAAAFARRTRFAANRERARVRCACIATRSSAGAGRSGARRTGFCPASTNARRGAGAAGSNGGRTACGYCVDANGASERNAARVRSGEDRAGATSAVAASSASPAPPAATAPGTTTPAAATPAVAATSAMAAPEASQGRAYGAVDEPSRIVIEVRKDSWLQIHDGDRLLLDKVLHPGDSYRVGDRVGLVMRTGNAAGLDIEVDGQQGAADQRHGPESDRARCQPLAGRNGVGRLSRAVAATPALNQSRAAFRRCGKRAIRRVIEARMRLSPARFLR